MAEYDRSNNISEQSRSMRSRESNHQNEEQEYGQGIGQQYQQVNPFQGQRVHFQDQQNSDTNNDINYNEISDRQPLDNEDLTEENDIVHNLRGEDPISAGINQGADQFALQDQKLPRKLSQGKKLSNKHTKEGFEDGIISNNLPNDMNDMQNISQAEDIEQLSYNQTYTVTPYAVDLQHSYDDFENHVKDCSVDFKENVVKKVQIIKIEDTQQLNERVEELKTQEARELAMHNKKYIELDGRCKKLDRKNSKYETVIENWIEQWRQKRQTKILMRFLRNWAAQKARENRQLDYCDTFYEAGCKRRGIKAFKLFAQINGVKVYERRMKEKVTIEVEAKVIEKRNQLEFLEAMIKELEEKYRIELRKKAILKSSCDQAYLRGVSAISMEALKMSHSTLNDYYKGMKMPNYDGKNIFNQIKAFNGASTGYQEINDNENQSPNQI